MKEIVRIIRRDFDTLENQTSDAITETCLATFIEENGLTASGHATNWFKAQEPVKLYLAWITIYHRRRTSK